MASIPNDITWNGGKCTWLYLHNRKQRFPLGPKTLPLVGNILDFQVRSVRVLAVRTADFWRYGDHPYWHFANPGNFTIQEIAGALRQMIGDSLLTIDGDAHRQQRHLVQPAFHSKRIESYSQVMILYTQEMLEGWNTDEEIDMSHATQELTLRIFTSRGCPRLRAV